MAQAVKRNLQEARRNRVIVLEDLNFLWDQVELKLVEKMWKEGESVGSIIEKADRDPDEILLALIHLAREDKIKHRKGGLFGAYE